MLIRCGGKLHNGELVDISNFYRSKKNKSGYQRICKSCTKHLESLRNAEKILVTEKVCNECEQTKPVSDFYKATRLKDGYRPECRDCSHKRKGREVTPPKRQRQSQEWYSLGVKCWTYGITREDFQRMLLAQEGKCKICSEEKPLVVDHDHSCCDGKKSCGKCVRALICSSCNTGLGMFKDSPNKLQSAYDYLLSHVR